MGVASVFMAVASVVGTVMSIKNGQDQKAAAEKSASQQQANADKQASAADQANNAANRKSADTTALLSASSQSGRSGQSGTMLTGPQGIDADALKLGKSTLLGQ